MMAAKHYLHDPRGELSPLLSHAKYLVIMFEYLMGSSAKLSATAALLSTRLLSLLI